MEENNSMNENVETAAVPNGSSMDIKALNEKIRSRLSVYDLLKETAETIRTQTYADMRTVFDELQKKHYYG